MKLPKLPLLDTPTRFYLSTVEQGTPQNASAFLPEANIGAASGGFNVRVTVNAGGTRGFTQGSTTRTWQPLLLSVWVDAVDSKAFRERIDQILAAGEVARSVVRESRLSLLPITLGVTKLGSEDVTYRAVDGIEDWVVRPRKGDQSGMLEIRFNTLEGVWRKSSNPSQTIRL
jgi:hypothetical protein